MPRKQQPDVVSVQVRKRRSPLKSLLGAVILLVVIGAIANAALKPTVSNTLPVAAGPSATPAPSDTAAPPDTPQPSDTPAPSYSAQTVTLAHQLQRIGVMSQFMITVHNTGIEMPNATIAYIGLEHWDVVGAKSTCGNVQSWSFPQPGYSMGRIPPNGVCVLELDAVPQDSGTFGVSSSTLARPDLSTQAGGEGDEYHEYTVSP
jgi:hypothetical protein